jgi:transposase
MDTSYEINRLDHYGIVAGMIKQLGIIELVDNILGIDEREEVTAGECVAAMIINGLGFTSQPLSLTERFFNKKPLELLFGRANIKASFFNRHKLAKILDKIHAYGCEKLFYQISLQCCSKANIDIRYSSLDTTSISVTGEYDVDSDENTIEIVHGFSKDCRPDLKQCIHELLVSQDGGIPLMMKSHSGNSSDSVIFKERTQMLIEHFNQSEQPRYLIADGKLYSSSNAANLKLIKFITRISGTLKITQSKIISAFLSNEWLDFNISKKEQYQSFDVEHYGIQQRWLIVKSDYAEKRARKRVSASIKKEYDFYSKKLKDFSKMLFSSEKEAKSNLDVMCSKLGYHKLSSYEITVSTDKQHCSILGVLSKDLTKEQEKINQHSCYVLGTNIDKEEISNNEVINIYKQQNIAIENTGFRFLKDPKFFAQSFFVKKPQRIEALLFIMTSSLLVYSIAQRSLRLALKHQNEKLPDQIKKLTNTPTLRWVFQLMDDIHVLYRKVEDRVTVMIEGLIDLKEQIINFFGQEVKNIYFGTRVNTT